MKSKLNIIILLALAFALTSFMPAKYSKDFKKQKKEMESLTILKPIVRIMAENNQTSYYDSTLSNSNQDLLEKATFSLLRKKYKLRKAQLPQFNQEQYQEILKNLEKSDKTLDGISFYPIINKVGLKLTSRFALLFIFNGTINPNFQPHHNISSGIASNRVIIAPHSKPRVDLQLLIIDTENNEVVFYNRKKTSNYDPRSTSEMEQMAKLILKKIYYK